MAEVPVIAGPAVARALLAGWHTRWRALADGPLSRCGPGDRLIVREACIPGRIRDGGEVMTDLARAEFVVFPDGWRHYPDGTGHRGPLPRDADEKWIAAVHMPRWAVRIELIVERSRTEPVQAVTRGGMRAEGLRPLLGGLVWRWPSSGIGLSSRRLYARRWDLDHPTPGCRWQDNPSTIVLDVRRA